MIEHIKPDLFAYITQAKAASRTSGLPAPSSSDTAYRVHRKNGKRALEEVTKSAPDYGHAIHRMGSALRSLPAFQILASKIHQDTRLITALRLRCEKPELEEDLFYGYLLPMVAHSLSQEDAGTNPESATHNLLAALDLFVEKDTFAVTVSNPLWNFKCDAYPLAITDDVTATQVSDAELEVWINSIVRIKGFLGAMDFLSLDFQLKRIVQQPRPPCRQMWFGGGESQRLFDDLLTSMRLAKNGAVENALLAMEGSSFLGPGPRQIVIPGERKVFGPPYDLSSADIPLIKANFSSLHSLDNDARFSLALRRFRHSYEERSGADKLIDYWIALEALLLPDGRAGELRFRASLRAAVLLAAPGDRVEIFKRMKSSYDSRSSVVHGQLTDVEASVTIDTERYLRQLLCMCLSYGSVPSQEKLDSIVLGVPETPSNG